MEVLSFGPEELQAQSQGQGWSGVVEKASPQVDICCFSIACSCTPSPSLVGKAATCRTAQLLKEIPWVMPSVLGVTSPCPAHPWAQPLLSHNHPRVPAACGMRAGPANCRCRTRGWKYFPVLLHVAWVSDWPQLTVSAVNIWPQLTTGLKRSRICPLSHGLPSLHVSCVLGTVHQCWLGVEGRHRRDGSG